MKVGFVKFKDGSWQMCFLVKEENNKLYVIDRLAEEKGVEFFYERIIYKSLLEDWWFQPLSSEFHRQLDKFSGKPLTIRFSNS